MPIKKSYLLIFFSIIFFHLVGVFFLYKTFPNYDIFMHVGTGLVLSFIIYDKLQKYIEPTILKYFLVMCVLIFLGVIWELGEYVWDQTISTYYNFSFLQLSLKDTLGDLLMDIIGSALFIFVIAFRNLTNR